MVEGFSPSWLDLREAADHRSCDVGLRMRFAGWMARFARPNILDLGAGTGSNLRRLAPYLGPVQDWILLDHDPAILAAARARLADWADEVALDGEVLVLRCAGAEITVRFLCADLAQGFAGLPRADAVTASAFFDLASEDFVHCLARHVVGQGSGFHAVLSFDGRQEWFPPHQHDAAMLRAFLAHQQGDKGLGAALGSSAQQTLEAAFGQAGYDVAAAPSSWILDREDQGLLVPLAAGFADAAAETGLLAPTVTAAWRAASRERGIVGHRDILALPPLA